MGVHILETAIPSVPHGPSRVDSRVADADYYRAAASNIRFQASCGNAFAGSNLTETVARLCEAAAGALEAEVDAERTVTELAERQAQPNGLEGVL